MAQNFQNNGPVPPQYGGGYGHQPYYQPPRNNGGGNKVLLTIVIVLLTALLVGGAVWLFMDSNKKKEVRQEQIVQEEKDAKVRELQAENDRLKEENAKKPEKVVVERMVTTTPKTSTGTPKVVVNGVGVRLRFGPGTDYGYLTWANGQTRAPRKGEKLEYIDETDGWYHVRYKGSAFYISKEFSYLTY